MLKNHLESKTLAAPSALGLFQKHYSMPKFIDCINQAKAFYNKKENQFISRSIIKKIKSFRDYLLLIEHFPVTDDNKDIFKIILLEFVQLGDINVVKAFLKNSSVNINQVYLWGKPFSDSDRLTMLSKAAHYGRKEIVTFLLDLGADYNTRDMSLTPFMEAVENNHVETVAVFLEKIPFKNLIPLEGDLEKLNKCLTYTRVNFHKNAGSDAIEIHDTAKAKIKELIEKAIASMSVMPDTQSERGAGIGR